MRKLDRDKLSQLMIKLRNSRDLNRDDMGTLLGVSGKTVKRWEKGESLPTMEDAIHICNEFNITLEEMFEGQINIDREVSRKLTKVDSGIETISNNINDLKEQLVMIQSESKDSREGIIDDLTWLWLLIIHLAATTVCFLCYMMWRMNVIVAFLFSVMYVVSISCLTVKNRNNMKCQGLILLYSLFLEINMLLNYVFFADVAPGVINNMEIMCVNGAMYGFRLLSLHDMNMLLCICSVVYIVWIIFSGYHLIRR